MPKKTSKKKPVTIVLEQEDVSRAQKLAKLNKRSVSNLIGWLISKEWQIHQN